METQNYPLNLNSRKLFTRYLAACVAWIIISFLGLIYHQNIVKVFEPIYIGIIEQVHPNYVARISYDNNETEPRIELFVTALKSVEFAPEQALPAGTTVGPTEITMYHTLVPMVIFAVIILVWPVASIKEFLVLLALAAPGLVIVTGITAPFQMLGLLDTAFMQQAALYRVEYDSTSYDWMRFTEGGARWLIPLLIGIICGLLANRIAGGKKLATE